MCCVLHCTCTHNAGSLCSVFIFFLFFIYFFSFLYHWQRRRVGIVCIAEQWTQYSVEVEVQKNRAREKDTEYEKQQWQRIKGERINMWKKDRYRTSERELLSGREMVNKPIWMMMSSVFDVILAAHLCSRCCMRGCCALSAQVFSL